MGLGGSAQLRWICIAVLAAALLLALPRQAPRNAEFGRLLDGVRSGAVTEVQIPGGSGNGSFVWHEGPLRWYRSSGPYDAQLQLEREATAVGGHGLSFADPDADRLWFQAVHDADEPTWLVVAAGGLWIGLFLVMLATREHAYATRWAWFWLFMVGGVGPILMLLKEPEPLRLRPRSRRPGGERPPRGRLTGPVGLAYAVFWAICLAVAASLLALLPD